LYYVEGHSMSASGQFVHAVWSDALSAIYYKRSTDGGLSWEPATQLSVAIGLAEYPFVLADGDVVHLVWNDWIGGAGNYELFYKRSTDGGASWESDVRLTYADDHSVNQTLAVSNQALHLAWADYRDGNYEIYYKQNPTGNTPVELVSFSANAIGNKIRLSWQTETEINNQGFDVQKSTDQNEFFTIGFVEGHGTTTESQAYSYLDKNVFTGNYKYRLKQIDFDGTFEYSDVIEVEVASPITFSLGQNYPNPFNPSTTIKYSMPSSEFVTLKVYDVLGNEVAALVNEEKQEGIFDIKLNATTLPSGTYFYQLKAGSFVETKKMILLR